MRKCFIHTVMWSFQDCICPPIHLSPSPISWRITVERPLIVLQGHDVCLAVGSSSIIAGAFLYMELSDCKTPETRLPPVLLCVGNSVSGLKSWAGLLLLKIFDLGTLWGHLIRQSYLILSSWSPGIEDEIGLSDQMSSGYVNVDVKCWRRHWQKYSLWQR